MENQKETLFEYVTNLDELDTLLHKYCASYDKIAIMCYMWKEYGFLPTIFNDYYRDFYEDVVENKCFFLGLCFEGHEIFYKNKVDILIVLKGFIDTSKAYQNNKETTLFLTNLSLVRDRGIAFLNTILNFDYVFCESIINKYKWSAIIYPTLFDGWYHSAVPYHKTNFEFGKGFGKTYNWSKGKYIKEWFSWNLELCDEYKKGLVFEKIIDEEYDILICKNSWKTRDYRSSNVNDFTGTKETTREVGFINSSYVTNLCNKYIENGKTLVVVNDLLEFDLPTSGHIKIINMKHYLDVNTLISLLYHSKLAYIPPTAALDLVLYFCSVDLKIISQTDKDDGLNYKKMFMDIVQKKNNKTWEVVYCI